MRYAPYTSSAIHASCATTRIDILARCVNRLRPGGAAVGRLAALMFCVGFWLLIVLAVRALI